MKNLHTFYSSPTFMPCDLVLYIINSVTYYGLGCGQTTESTEDTENLYFKPLNSVLESFNIEIDQQASI